MIEETKAETLHQHASEVRIDLNPGGKVRRGGRPHAGSFNEGENNDSQPNLKTPIIEENSAKNNQIANDP